METQVGGVVGWVRVDVGVEVGGGTLHDEGDMGEAVTATCPACGNAMRVRAELLGKRVKCPGCGASFLAAGPAPAATTPSATAQAPTAVSPARAARTPGASTGRPGGGPGGGGRGGRAEDPTEQVRERRKVVLQLAAVFALLVIVGGGVWGFKTFGGGGGVGARAGVGGGIDEEVETAIRAESGTEARAWLAASNRRMFGGLNERQANALLDHLYNRGAVKVYAFSGLITYWLAVELPADPTKRADLLEYINKYNEAFADEKKQTDTGQRYARVRLRM